MTDTLAQATLRETLRPRRCLQSNQEALAQPSAPEGSSTNLRRHALSGRAAATPLKNDFEAPAGRQWMISASVQDLQIRIGQVSVMLSEIDPV